MASTASTPDASQAGGSRQSRKRLRTRESIINAAWLCFTRGGVESTSMRDVAELADVSEATLYNHFKNRAELLTSVVEQTQKTDLALMVEAVAELGETRTPIDVLRCFAERIRRESLEDLQALRRFRELTRSAPELRAAYLANRDESTALLVQALGAKASASGMSEQALLLLCESYAHLSEVISAQQDETSTPESWADQLNEAIQLLQDGWER